MGSGGSGDGKGCGSSEGCVGGKEGLEEFERVRILHISDTHGMHDYIEQMPEFDILIHTGDFTNEGSQEEFGCFDSWLGKLICPHKIFITGNHDLRTYDLRATDIRAMVPHATFLDHEAIDVMGIRIFGSPWVPRAEARRPDHGAENRFGDIPEGIDILLTHGPPRGILDCLELTTSPWGSSPKLLEAVKRAKPRVHCFGHVHEQRGFWQHAAPDAPFEGGCEYKIKKGVPLTVAPPPDYPCQVISCNAMANHSGIDSGSRGIMPGKRIGRMAGPPRMILAERPAGGVWSFKVDCPPQDATPLTGDRE